MVKRLIGSDTTGTDGSVSIPYNGTGAGLVNLSVETEIDGSIVSGTFTVLDCIWLDKNGATWTTGSGSTTFSDDVRTFTTSTDSNFYANNDAPFTGDFACEFDLRDYYGGNMLRFYGDTGKQISFSDLGGVSQGCHIMIKSLNKQVTIFVDGVQKSYNFSYTSNGLELGFRVLANMLTKISNYKVYPI